MNHSIPINSSDRIRFEEFLRFYSGNNMAFNLLQQAVMKENVIPFVGSGASAFAYKTWKEMLEYLSGGVDDLVKADVTTYIDNDEYLKAAQILCDSMGEMLFYTALREMYSEDKIDSGKLSDNAAYYIPYICGGNCLTTNYDRVLEHACNENSIPYDVAGIHDTYKLNTFLRERKKQGMIFKLHGDILSNKSDILLTESAYRENYTAGKPLRKELEKWITGRLFLFIGCSLLNDWTVRVLMNRMEEGIVNYVIYGCRKSEVQSARERFEEMGIIPLFYDSNDHSYLTIILKILTSGICP